MRETIEDWKNDWIETNGVTDDVEILIRDSKHGDDGSYVYEGSFAEIPQVLLKKRVIECGRIVDSSIPQRIGAYTLTV